MKRAQTWNELTTAEKLEIYDYYCEHFEEHNDYDFLDDPGSFEDFDDRNRFNTARYARQYYGKGA